ncbi:MAG: hypothetical protein ACKVP2_14370 [Burkholderiales bacterium]
MFTNPMWFDEVQRIGFMKCSSKAYRLYTTSDLVGLMALLVFMSIFVVPFFFTFWVSLYCFIGSILLIAIRILVYSRACSIVDSKGFKFDYKNRIGTWLENGEQKSYSYEDFKNQ